MSKSILLRMSICVPVLLSTISVTYADAIDGLYLRENNVASSQLRVFDCGGGKGIKVEKSSHKPSEGKQLMCGAKANGGKWVGRILNLEDGKHYDATISLSGNNLKLRGCITNTPLCKNQFFTRLK